MENRETEFGGAAGRVLNDAMSLSSLISGLFITFALFVLGMIAGVTEATALPFLVSQIGMAIVLARFAVNGAAGEWNGTLFSTHGGDWVEVVAVAIRYLILNLVWMLPLISLGLSLPTDAQAFQTMVQDREFGKVFMLAAYLAAMVLTPPVFLIIATAAQSLPGIVTPAVWAATLGGRTRDLFAVYSVYIGGLCVAALVSLPPILLVAGSWPVLALVMFGLTAAFFVGFGPNLLGRLCGMFVLGEWPPPGRRASSPPAPAASSHRRPARAVPVAALAGVVPGAAAYTAPVPHGMPGVSRSPLAAPGPHPAVAPPAVRLPAAAGLGSAPPPPAVAPSAGPKRVLLDVRERLEDVWGRFDQNPQAAIAAVAEMHASSFTPHPLVVHALTLMRLRAGDTAGAQRAAIDAMPILFERGNLQLAADLYRALLPNTAGLSLTREQLLTLGGALTDMGDTKNAANTFASVLQADPTETRAVRGMLKVGESMLQTPNGAVDALRLFTYLRQQAPATPLSPEIESGQRQAERILARR